MPRAASTWRGREAPRVFWLLLSTQLQKDTVEQITDFLTWWPVGSFTMSEVVMGITRPLYHSRHSNLYRFLRKPSSFDVESCVCRWHQDWWGQQSEQADVEGKHYIWTGTGLPGDLALLENLSHQLYDELRRIWNSFRNIPPKNNMECLSWSFVPTAIRLYHTIYLTHFIHVIP